MTWISWVALVLLGFLIAFCALFAGLLVVTEVYYPWSTGDLQGWHGAGPAILIYLLALFASFASLGLFFAIKRKEYDFPRRTTIAMFIVLLASCASFFTSSLHYAALAVLLLGPGQHSRELQRISANADSTLVFNALALRRATVDPSMMNSAAYGGRLAVLKWLIQHGVDINGQAYKERETPLHSAVERKQYMSAQILLDAGARTDIADARGRLPIDLATRLEDTQMIDILSRGRGASK